jgi:hypothetical protein
MSATRPRRDTTSAIRSPSDPCPRTRTIEPGADAATTASSMPRDAAPGTMTILDCSVPNSGISPSRHSASARSTSVQLSNDVADARSTSSVNRARWGTSRRRLPGIALSRTACSILSSSSRTIEAPCPCVSVIACLPMSLCRAACRITQGSGGPPRLSYADRSSAGWTRKYYDMSEPARGKT